MTSLVHRPRADPGISKGGGGGGGGLEGGSGGNAPWKKF